MTSDFSHRLKLARKHAKITQKALCEAVGMSQSTLSELESGGYESGKTAQIAHECGVDAYWLATGEGSMLAPIQAVHVAESAAAYLTLPDVLRRLAEAVAQVPADRREQLSDALAQWVKYGGSEIYLGLIVQLLDAVPGKRQRAA